MNLQYLQYALEVEKTGSISKAASNLYMNQPNLSKAIKELENMIGFSLFERTTKGVSSTTAEGQVFMEYARNILEQFEGMKSHFQAAKAKESNLRISIPRASYITEAFASFINEIADKSDFCISYQETNFIQAIKSVSQEGYNLGIIRYRAVYEKYFLSIVGDKELDSKEILEADSMVLISGKNSLSHRDALEFSDLAPMIEIANDDFALPRQLNKGTESGVPQGKKRILVYERGSQFDILAHIPQAYMWVSPMPKGVLERNGLMQKKCPGGIRFKDVLIYRRGHVFSQLENIFLRALEKGKASLSLE